MEQIYLTPVEIAPILKISKARVHLLIANEEFPFNRYHHRIVVKLEDLNTYIAKKAAGVSPAEQESSRASNKSPPPG